MEVRNNLDALRSLLGVSVPAEQTISRKSADASALELSGDKATLSAGAAAVSQTSSSSDVRMEKVAAIQAAIASGTYSIPASAVAGKMIDAMLADASITGVKSN